MYDSPYYFVIFLFIVVIYHNYIQNAIEKRFSLEYFGYDNVKRPLSGLGMPSGAVESATILFLLLFLYKYIPLWLCLLFIFIVSLQRIITQKHTIIQVIVGIVCGLIYTHIYKSHNLSILSFGIVILIGLLLTLLIYYKVKK